MVVEFCNTRDEQHGEAPFCKYSIMRVGDRFIPRHILFSRNWVTKTADTVDVALAAEELRFVEARHVPPEIVTAFEVAGVQYGRIDYGLLRGRPQVWEINLNPVIVPQLANIAPQRHAAQKLSASYVRDAFEALLTG